MKKVFLVLPLAIVLANCSSTHNSTGSSASGGANASTGTTDRAGLNATASTSGSGSTASMNAGSSASSTSTASAAGNGSTDVTANGSGNWTSSSNPGSVSGSSKSLNNNGSTASSGTTNWDVYDPNNYMQNPEKYRKPYELGKAGGWTYNKDWRRNTNFTADAVGQWQLVLTPEVAANWMPDTRRPETYASFWTPEAVMGRYQAGLAAAARTQDSIAALNVTESASTAALGKGRRKSLLAGKTSSGAGSMSGGTWTSGSGTTGTVGSGGSAVASGSGTTGTIGAGGSSSTAANANTGNTSTAMNNNVTIPYALTAVNGNNFMLPTLNMYIDNGSFTAFTGCNSALGNIVVNGSSLHFDEATPSTNVECIGGFDQSAFIDRLRRADSYDVVNNQFRLKQGDQVLMVFEKKAR